VAQGRESLQGSIEDVHARKRIECVLMPSSFLYAFCSCGSPTAVSRLPSQWGFTGLMLNMFTDGGRLPGGIVFSCTPEQTVPIPLADGSFYLVSAEGEGSAATKEGADV
jgi:hypothetical protein